MLGLVIPDIANPFWAEVARGAQDKAAEKGASLLVFSSDWDPVREANHLRALRHARVDGAIVNPVEDSIDDLGRFGMPVVHTWVRPSFDKHDAISLQWRRSVS